jgi:hypothetical protein
VSPKSKVRKLLRKKGTLIKLKTELYSDNFLKLTTDIDTSPVLFLDAVQKENWHNLREKLAAFTLAAIKAPHCSHERFFIKVFFNGQILWIKVREDDIIFL